MAGPSERARIGRALLALCGHRSDEAAALGEAAWGDLDQLAHEHRLRPFLHGREMRGELPEVPEAIARAWQETHRANAVTMLVQRRALLHAVDTLALSAIGCVALKGAALAWTVWPAPVERAMRDIDLLVDRENAARAYIALRAAGWEGPELGEAALAAFAADETHFPPLFSADGVMCELHARVWGKAPLPGSPMPRSDEAHMLGNARPSEKLGAAIPSNEDMLAHLVVHAACAHLLNVGPQVLVDVDLWCARKPLDWPAFWQRARRDGFERPAALVCALVDRWRRPGFMAESACPVPVASDLLDESELLLVQNLDARKDVSVIASVAQGRPGGRLAQHPLDRAAGGAGPMARLGQITARARSIGRSLLSPATRRDGMATARLQKWMEG